MGMNPNSPLALSQLAGRMTEDFLAKAQEYNIKMMKKIFQEIFSLNGLVIYSHDTELESYAFSWQGSIYYHPDLSETQKGLLQRWEIKSLPPSLEETWSAFYRDWFVPIDTDRSIIRGLVNAAMNRSISFEDMRRLLPTAFSKSIETYENLWVGNPELVAAKLTDEDVEEFQTKHANVFQLVKERLAKNLLLGDYL